MHKIVVSRKHGTQEIKTLVKVDHEGSPEIEMKLDDFMTILISELGICQEDFIKAVDSMWNVFTKASTDQRLSAAFDKVDFARRLEQSKERALQRMKKDSAYLAKHIK